MLDKFSKTRDYSLDKVEQIQSLESFLKIFLHELNIISKIM